MAADSAGSAHVALVPSNRRLLLLVVLTAAAFAVNDICGHAVWHLMERSASGVRRWQVSSPRSPSIASVRFWLGFDTAFIALLVATLWTVARRLSGRWRTAVHVLTVLYAVGDLAENIVALVVLTRAAKASTGSVDALHALAFVKLGSVGVAIAIPLAIGLAELRLHRPTTLDEHPPPNLAPASADWAPNDRRFAIALSGGGIRSASFAHGALQELQEMALLEKARWVTAVSGGSYLASARTILNQWDAPTTSPATPTPPAAARQRIDPLGPGSPAERHLRTHLRYLVSGRRTVGSSVLRIVVGLLFNLFLLYLVMFAALRPVGWLIGTPLVQRGLRVDGAIAWSVKDTTDDPDFAPVGGATPDATGTRTQPTAVCGLGKTDTGATTVGAVTPLPQPQRGTSTDRNVRWFAVEIIVPTQCVEVHPKGTTMPTPYVVSLTAAPAVVAVEDATLRVDRQPELEISCMTAPPRQAGATAGAPPCMGNGHVELWKLFKVHDPKLKVISDDPGVDLARLRSDAATFLEVGEPARLTVAPAIDLRGDLDVDVRHWAPAVALLAIAVLALLVRITFRPDWYRLLNRLIAATGTVGLAWMAVGLVLPWLVARQPLALTHLGTVGPSIEVVKRFGAAAVPANLPPILAWLFLSVSAVWRYLSRKPKPADATRPRNARALSAKIGQFLVRVAVGVVLIGIAVVNAVNILVVGAMNGPVGRNAWLTLLWWDGLRTVWPADIVLWLAAVVALLALRHGPESTAWSAGPIYKRALARAFAIRSVDGAATARDYGPDDAWSDFVARPENRTTDERRRSKPEAWGSPSEPMGAPGNDDERPDAAAAVLAATSDRAGFLDGALHDGTELVLCAAANVLGEGEAPTARRAMSYTMSRSYTGGPEIGWMRTEEYVARLSKRRSWDANIVAMTAISGAAVSPAMGRQSRGPIGSALSMLNVRLGAWLPNPQWVAAQPAGSLWWHSPGWTWFAREVLRMHRRDAKYLYVTDGGHWENLGLVEALRRGAKHVVVISAAGDGELSNATLAESIEIARSDLGIEIRLDDAWKTRPSIGGTTPDTLPSGRQYILDPSTNPTLGRAARQGFAFGTFTVRDANGDVDPIPGRLLLIEAAMVDGLPVDVHAYSESHAEFPNVSTGDQFFTNQDFEAYRVLGRTIVRQAFATMHGDFFRTQVENCTRDDAATDRR